MIRSLAKVYLLLLCLDFVHRGRPVLLIFWTPSVSRIVDIVSAHRATKPEKQLRGIGGVDLMKKTCTSECSCAMFSVHLFYSEYSHVY